VVHALTLLVVGRALDLTTTKCRYVGGGDVTGALHASHRLSRLAKDTPSESRLFIGTIGLW